MEQFYVIFDILMHFFPSSLAIYLAECVFDSKFDTENVWKTVKMELCHLCDNAVPGECTFTCKEYSCIIDNATLAYTQAYLEN